MKVEWNSAGKGMVAAAVYKELLDIYQGSKVDVATALVMMLLLFVEDHAASEHDHARAILGFIKTLTDPSILGESKARMFQRLAKEAAIRESVRGVGGDPASPPASSPDDQAVAAESREPAAADRLIEEGDR